MKARTFAGWVITVAVASVPVAPASAQKIYWADVGGIFRANTDGSGRELIVSTPSAVNTGIALDSVTRKIYWGSLGTESVERASFNGSQVRTLVTNVFPRGIAVDLAAGKIYWTDSSRDLIERANLDGTEVETVVSGLVSPRGLALDTQVGKIYWTDAATRKVQRANLDGSLREDLLVAEDAGLTPVAVALDLSSAKMYVGLVDDEWGTDGKIQRANLDGSEVEDIVPPIVLPYGLALDLQAGRLYFISPAIERANLDGTDVEVLTTEVSQPGGIALDPGGAQIPALSPLGCLVTGVLLVVLGAFLSARNSRRDRKQHCCYTVLIFCAMLYSSGTSSGQILSRRPFPKPASIHKPDIPAWLLVKFRDDLKVRSSNGRLSSPTGTPLHEVERVVDQFELSFEPLLALSKDTIDVIERRAETRSGVAQPDLRGMMVIRARDAVLNEAASALLSLTEVEWAYFAPLGATSPCSDIAPPTADWFGQRIALGIDDYHGPDPGVNVSDAQNVYGARGQGILIADCETGFIRGHEDLCDINEPAGQTLENDEHPHGAAVLGILAALENTYGWTGLAPDASPWFFSQQPAGTAEVTPITRATAVANAIATAEPGDVVLLEMQTSGDLAPAYPIFGAPAELNPSVWHLTKCATHSDIIVVAAGGNGNWNLDCPACPECPDDQCFDFSEYRERGDSGAILVGGGSSVTQERCQKFEFQIGCVGPAVGTTYGQGVNVQGWFADVFSLGYGDYDDGGGDVRQTYTAEFDGTSAASAIVAGCVAAIQSFVDTQYGCRLKPLQMRDLLVDTGVRQGPLTCPPNDPDACEHIGPLPNVYAAVGLLNTLGAQDCNNNQVPDACEYGDCDDDGVNDICQIAAGSSQDCNANSVPDACEPDEDCQPNGVRDICDIGAGTSQDCNGNSVPDECDLAGGYSEDCNGNGVPDECDLWQQTSEDCNFNVVPDACDDCNANGIQDSCDVDCGDPGGPCDVPGCGQEADCNGNCRPDECDLASGSSADCNENGVPDECVGEHGCCTANDCGADDPGVQCCQNECAECCNDADCGSGDLCCNNACRTWECCNDGHCAAPTPACLVSTHTCVECVDDSHCTDPATPYCGYLQDPNVCVECNGTTPSQCPGFNCYCLETVGECTCCHTPPCPLSPASGQ